MLTFRSRRPRPVIVPILWALAAAVTLFAVAHRAGAQSFRVLAAPDSAFVGDSVVIRVEARAAGASAALVARPALRAATFNRQALDLTSAAFSRVKLQALAVGTARVVVLWDRSDNPMVVEHTVRVVSRTPAPTPDPEPGPIVVTTGLQLARDTIAAGDTLAVRFVLPDSMAGDSVHWILPEEGRPTLYEAVLARAQQQWGGQLDALVTFRTGKDTIQRTMTRLDSIVRYTTTANAEAWGALWRDIAMYPASFVPLPGVHPATRLDSRWAVPLVAARPGAQAVGVVHYRGGVERGRYYRRVVVAGALPPGTTRDPAVPAPQWVCNPSLPGAKCPAAARRAAPAIPVQKDRSPVPPAPRPRLYPDEPPR